MSSICLASPHRFGSVRTRKSRLCRWVLCGSDETGPPGSWITALTIAFFSQTFLCFRVQGVRLQSGMHVLVSPWAARCDSCSLARDPSRGTKWRENLVLVCTFGADVMTQCGERDPRASGWLTGTALAASVTDGIRARTMSGIWDERGWRLWLWPFDFPLGFPQNVVGRRCLTLPCVPRGLQCGLHNTWASYHMADARIASSVSTAFGLLPD